MIDHSSRAPEELIRMIARDLKPVKPSPSPIRLVLETAPFALILSSLVLVSLGVRGDSGVLGPLLTWTSSTAQFALAIMLIWVAAHEGTPAGRLSRGTVYSTLLVTFLVVVGITVSTFEISPVGSTLRIAARMHVPLWVMDLVCGVGSTVMGGVLVFIFSLWFRNSLAVRPVVAGALYGAGAGIAINAGWRIACPYSTLRHSLGAHGAAIVGTVILGAFIARSLANRRWATRDTGMHR